MAQFSEVRAITTLKKNSCLTMDRRRLLAMSASGLILSTTVVGGCSTNEILREGAYGLAWLADAYLSFFHRWYRRVGGLFTSSEWRTDNERGASGPVRLEVRYTDSRETEQLASEIRHIGQPAIDRNFTPFAAAKAEINLASPYEVAEVSTVIEEDLRAGTYLFSYESGRGVYNPVTREDMLVTVV